MRLTFAIAAVVALTVPAAAQQAFCPYGQTCQGANPVPFPVINPAQGLSNVLTYPLRQNQPPPPPPVWNAPIPTPPPVMPPNMAQPGQ